MEGHFKMMETMAHSFCNHRFYWQQGYGMFSVGPMRTEDQNSLLQGKFNGTVSRFKF